MKNLFICWRPMQVINAINFVVNDYENTHNNSDIIIVNDFYGSEKIVKKLRTLNIFDAVIFTDIENQRSRYQIIHDLLFAKSYIRRKFGLSFNYNYDKIISSGWIDLVYTFDVANKHKARFIMLEDGIGSYLGDTREHEFNRKLKMIGKFLNKGPFSVKVDIQYVSEPSLCDFRQYNYPIEKIKIDMNNENLSKILYILFNLTEKGESARKKYIILDQPVESSLESDQKYNKNYLLNIIINQLSDKDIIFRKHPNSANSNIEYPKNITLQNSNDSWELYALSSISDNDILLSFHSTALVIPKLLYNKEPTIICLYNLIPFSNKNEIIEINKFFQKIKSIYGKKWKVIIPNNDLELIKLLKTF